MYIALSCILSHSFLWENACAHVRSIRIYTHLMVRLTPENSLQVSLGGSVRALVRSQPLIPTLKGLRGIHV